MSSFRTWLVVLLSILSVSVSAQIPVSTKNAEGVLFLGGSGNQPLIVGLGGSEGGNAWASNYWKPTRDQFIEKGYAFFALAYFGTKNTPLLLDRVAIDEVYAAIMEATKNSKVSRNRIAVIGGSRGGDLALLLGTYYPEIDCIVSIVGSSAVFPGHTNEFNSPCWTFEGKDLPYIPVNDEAVPFLKKGQLSATFSAMMSDSIAYQNAAIPVEKINGPVLMISATTDEICPSTYMAERMMTRLKDNNFRFHSEHIAVEGGHGAPLSKMQLVVDFIDKYFGVR